MDSALPGKDGYAAVRFVEGAQVARQMRAQEFGAFLDGYVGLSDLADTDVKAVYVLLDGQLQVRSLVFFRIWFDEEGRADSHWNLPVEELALEGASGPDLGAGPIRLVCRSQCPRPALADELWDPDMSPGQNQFQAIRKAIEANSLNFRRLAPEVPDEQVPVLRAQASGGQEDSERADRTRLARLIRAQRLRIKTLQSVHRDSVAEIRREHRLEMQGLRAEVAELEQGRERQRLVNEQLKERLAERNQQYLNLQEQLQQQATATEAGAQTRGAELVLLNEQLERRRRELALRDERIALLEQELEEIQQQEPAEDTLMRHLKDQSVFLVAYHAGLGHMTLPFDDIERYFLNPTGFAADKCGLNEPAYLDWLDHYEQPVCRHQHQGRLCGQPVMRVSQPAEFRAGLDDRCDQHRPAARASDPAPQKNDGSR